jgi:hypothetical protein
MMNMRTVPTETGQPSRLGSAAVDGLIAGAVAGVAMLGYLLLTSGDAPIDLLNRFTGAGVLPSPLLGAVGHLAVSAIYGMTFAIVWKLLRGSQRPALRVIGGVVYGLMLFALAQAIILPGTESPLLALPTLHWGIAHLIYGLVLGLVYRSTRGG